VHLYGPRHDGLFTDLEVRDGVRLESPAKSWSPRKRPQSPSKPVCGLRALGRRRILHHDYQRLARDPSFHPRPCGDPRTPARRRPGGDPPFIDFT